LRVLLDARGRVPATGPLFDTDLAPTLVLTTTAAPPDAIDAWTHAGAKVEVVAPGADGTGVDLDAVFALLGGGREGFVQAMIEGGGTLLGAVLDAGHAQRLVAYVAPILLGERGTPGYRLDGPTTLAAARRFALTSVRRLGSDVRLDYDLTDRGAV
jgi:diaminohydroxyphosphoribosylaminopyrimidine deaminase/5-amino-6-(5-phosphoribosylamino)uracil reductase